MSDIICCICLHPPAADLEYYTLDTDPTESDLSLKERLLYCVPEFSNVLVDDEKSTWMCSLCCQALCYGYIFRKKCLEHLEIVRTDVKEDQTGVNNTNFSVMSKPQVVEENIDIVKTELYCDEDFNYNVEEITERAEFEDQLDDFPLIEKACKTIPTLKENNIIPEKFNCWVQLELLDQNKVIQPQIKKKGRRKRKKSTKKALKPFRCGDCGKRYSNLFFLNSHQKWHSKRKNAASERKDVPVELSGSQNQTQERTQTVSAIQNVNSYDENLVTTKFQTLTLRRNLLKHKTMPKLSPIPKRKRGRKREYESMPLLFPAAQPEAKRIYHETELLRTSVLNIEQNNPARIDLLEVNPHESFDISAKPSFPALKNTTTASNVSLVAEDALDKNMQDYMSSVIKELEDNGIIPPPENRFCEKVNRGENPELLNLPETLDHTYTLLTKRSDENCMECDWSCNNSELFHQHFDNYQAAWRLAKESTSESEQEPHDNDDFLSSFEDSRDLQEENTEDVLQIIESEKYSVPELTVDLEEHVEEASKGNVKKGLHDDLASINVSNVLQDSDKQKPHLEETHLQDNLEEPKNFGVNLDEQALNQNMIVCENQLPQLKRKSVVDQGKMRHPQVTCTPVEPEVDVPVANQNADNEDFACREQLLPVLNVVQRSENNKPLPAERRSVHINLSQIPMQSSDNKFIRIDQLVKLPHIEQVQHQKNSTSASLNQCRIVYIPALYEKMTTTAFKSEVPRTTKDRSPTIIQEKLKNSHGINDFNETKSKGISATIIPPTQTKTEILPLQKDNSSNLRTLASPFAAKTLIVVKPQTSSTKTDANAPVLTTSTSSEQEIVRQPLKFISVKVSSVQEDATAKKISIMNGKKVIKEVVIKKKALLKDIESLQLASMVKRTYGRSKSATKTVGCGNEKHKIINKEEELTSTDGTLTNSVSAQIQMIEEEKIEQQQTKQRMVENNTTVPNVVISEAEMATDTTFDGSVESCNEANAKQIEDKFKIKTRQRIKRRYTFDEGYCKKLGVHEMNEQENEATVIDGKLSNKKRPNILKRRRSMFEEDCLRKEMRHVLEKEKVDVEIESENPTVEIQYDTLKSSDALPKDVEEAITEINVTIPEWINTRSQRRCKRCSLLCNSDTRILHFDNYHIENKRETNTVTPSPRICYNALIKLAEIDNSVIETTICPTCNKTFSMKYYDQAHKLICRATLLEDKEKEEEQTEDNIDMVSEENTIQQAAIKDNCHKNQSEKKSRKKHKAVATHSIINSKKTTTTKAFPNNKKRGLGMSFQKNKVQKKFKKKRPKDSLKRKSLKRNEPCSKKDRTKKTEQEECEEQRLNEEGHKTCGIVPEETHNDTPDTTTQVLNEELKREERETIEKTCSSDDYDSLVLRLEDDDCVSEIKEEVEDIFHLSEEEDTNSQFKMIVQNDGIPTLNTDAREEDVIIQLTDEEDANSQKEMAVENYNIPVLEHREEDVNVASTQWKGLSNQAYCTYNLIPENEHFPHSNNHNIEKKQERRSESFNELNGLKLHLVVHKNNKQVKKKMKAVQQRIDEIQERVINLKKYPCKKCEMCFESNDVLKMHCVFKHGS